MSPPLIAGFSFHSISVSFALPSSDVLLSSKHPVHFYAEISVSYGIWIILPVGCLSIL